MLSTAHHVPEPQHSTVPEPGLDCVDEVGVPNENAETSNSLTPSMVDSQAPGSDIDPNLSRRKRRKITPSPLDEAEHANQPNESRAWLDQLEDAASEDVAAETGAAAAERFAEVELSPESRVATTAAAGVRPTTPPPQPMFDGVHEGQSGENHHPTTRMMKLNGGKLGKSPKRAPNLDPPLKPSPKKNTRQNRNLTTKRGRIVQTLQVRIPYRELTEDRQSLGARIDAILEQPPQPAGPAPTLLPGTQQPQQPQQSNSRNPTAQKALHPFFGGKPTKQQPASNTASEDEKPDSKTIEPVKGVKPAKAWNEFIFSTSKSSSSKDMATLPAPWPPRDVQRVQPPGPSDAHPLAVEAREGTAKQKRRIVHISGNESILELFASSLRSPPCLTHKLRLPSQLHLKGNDLMRRVIGSVSEAIHYTKILAIENQICNGRSAFDRGMAAGPLDWTHEYAPKRAEDVLQEEVVVLRDWLRKLKIHNVQSKIAQRQQKRPPTRKKRPKKRPEDLEGFLMSSDEENDGGVPPVKNSILICGPPGSGKTASVFAVAHELDFEVFEIHPGMRRTAKDIYDKVGDMTHNHLVQATASAPLSRASSVLSDMDQVSDETPAVDSKQKSLAGFLGKKGSEVPLPKPRPEKEILQKQSLILFEEVDVLFDEDKTFWAGVQSLIATSKRPIVLTCNSLQNIPLDDLNLHVALHYAPPSTDNAVEHLAHIAAAEGHIIDRNALRTLYDSRGKDLRASLADLNFWCQMTVGSTMGGLDWMHGGDLHTKRELDSFRIVSQDTFHDGLHLVPEEQLHPEDMLAFAQDSLNLSIMDWEASRPLIASDDAEPHARLESLRRAEMVAEFQSCMDIVDGNLQGRADFEADHAIYVENVVRFQPCMSCLLSKAMPDRQMEVTRCRIVRFKLSPPHHSPLGRKAIVEALDPITEDNRTFPPPTGRTAPSIDGGDVTIATEVAPYIRHIVWLDQQLERQRDEIDASSQGTGRQRTTRAARAALEGSSVGNTRVERWFPRDLDFAAILATGGGWHIDQTYGVVADDPPSISRESTDATASMDLE